MKTFLFFLCISIPLFSFSQIKIGADVGSGAAFVFEDADVDLDYAAPVSIGFNMGLDLCKPYFSPQFRVSYMNARVEGPNWQNTSEVYDGDVSVVSGLALLEHLQFKNKWNLGYNFGAGYSEQRIRPFSATPNAATRIEDSYISMQATGIIQHSMNNRLSLEARPTLLWTDVVNSFRRENFQIANEDLNVLVQVGVSYRY